MLALVVVTGLTDAWHDGIWHCPPSPLDAGWQVRCALRAQAKGSGHEGRT